MIGQTVYFFDVNRRVYQKPASGKLFASGGPIYREHFIPQKVVSETSRSWVTQNGTKFPKNGKNSAAYTLEQVDDAVWKHAHAVKISDLVRTKNVETLRKIAKLINYEATE